MTIVVAAFLFVLPHLCSSAIIIKPSLQNYHLSSAALNSSAYPPIHQTAYHFLQENDSVFCQLLSYIKQAPDVEIELKSTTVTFTFFAPENAAFDRLLPEQLKLFESDVSSHLKYHLLPIVVAVKDMRDGSQELTEQGSPVFVTVQDDQRDVWINDAYIVDGDHVTENGTCFLLRLSHAQPRSE